jgi:protein tyrosine phosphatase (PTP) superfamily phosphohydrolase (DUF442 family)
MKNLMLTTASIIALTATSVAAVTLADLDTNADGSVDISEVQAVAPTITQEEFDSIDRDGSKGWNAGEFDLAADMLVKYLPASSGPEFGMDLNTLDSNADGSADIDEVRAVAPTITQDDFNMIDADGSGGWNLNEMTDAAYAILGRGTTTPASGEVVALATLDSNADGSADIDEVRAVSPTITQDEFNEVDQDGSGGWNGPEMGAAAQNLLMRK